MSLLDLPLSIRVSGRVVLRAMPERSERGLNLVERDGTRICATAPVAVLLDRPDLIDALAPEGADLSVFWGGGAHFRLLVRREIGGASLLIRTPDGEERDAHETPIAAILPRLFPIPARATPYRANGQPEKPL